MTSQTTERQKTINEIAMLFEMAIHGNKLGKNDGCPKTRKLVHSVLKELEFPQ